MCWFPAVRILTFLDEAPLKTITYEETDNLITQSIPQEKPATEMAALSVFPVSEQSLEDRIRAKLCKSYDEKEFLPADAIDSLTSREIVEAHLETNRKELPRNISTQSLADYVTNPTEPAKKLFLALSFCEQLDKLSSLVEAGFRDKNLPIAAEQNKAREDKFCYIVRTLNTGQVWEVFETWKAKDLEFFRANQWRFVAPVFTTESFDYRLNDNCPLPILKKISHQKGGFFSSVFEVDIHEAHQQVLLKVIQCSHVTSGVPI